ncbi:MAG: hypothetical protein SGPRY_013286, partial [Prymnesium sp.]
LTHTVADGVRVVVSSGGPAGAAASEGQAYGLLLTGLAMTSAQGSSPPYRQALTFGEELFAGSRRMCAMSRRSCQEDGQAMCGGKQGKRSGESTPGFSACLPAWRFDVSLRSQLLSGSASDADEDALLGLLLMLACSDALLWPAWHAAAAWAYETARAFLQYNTIEAPEGL